MKAIFIPVLLCLLGYALAQTDTNYSIKVCFLYGSKPKRHCHATEKKAFGGLHGGHVTIQVNDVDYGFQRADGFHVFAHRRRFKADFVNQPLYGLPRYDSSEKTVTFIIPVTAGQYARLNAVSSSYCKATPYDYAFFGMRCAAAAQDILGQTGLVKQRKRWVMVITTFYPKRLRKRLFKLARRRHYTVIKTEGRIARKWERD